MIDLKRLREDPDLFREGARLKNCDASAIDRAIDADRRRVEAQQEHDRLKAEQNAAGKSIGKLPADQKQAAVAQLGALKADVKAADERMKAASAELEAAALLIPLPPDPDVPRGKDDTENVVVRTHGEPRTFDFEPKDHATLCRELGLADFEAGVKLAGSRSYVLTGTGARLHNAVLQFALDLMLGHGFTPATVPVLVREEALVGTGFFPAGRDAVYTAQADGMHLVGTGEVGLTGLHMNQTLRQSDLPLKYTTVSTCFRREAGTYGKDAAGLYRVHQFDKCEQVVVCRADEAESLQWHQKMLGYSEELLQKLGLPYRVIDVCTGDLGVKNAAMYDVETFMPGRVRDNDLATGYGETHSASRLYDYQARRLNLRYKTDDGEIRFCHTLNNTVAASPRLLIPILENYQNADGSVTVPEVLRPRVGTDVIHAD
jgi:seryl-tRNA synthetase